MRQKLVSKEGWIILSKMAMTSRRHHFKWRSQLCTMARSRIMNKCSFRLKFNTG